MTTKKLSSKEVDLIVEFNQQFFSDGWTENSLISAFNSNGFNILVALEGEEVVGYIAYTIGLDSADIESVVVKPSERKKGIAGNLIDGAQKDIARCGIDKILLEVREGNIPAISLYIKNNFSVISKRNKYYHDGENALVMIKELV